MGVGSSQMVDTTAAATTNLGRDIVSSPERHIPLRALTIIGATIAESILITTKATINKSGAYSEAPPTEIS